MSDEALYDQLIIQGFRFVERWQTNEVLHFVRREIGKPRWPLLFAYCFMLLLIGITIWFGYLHWPNEDQSWIIKILIPFALGLASVIGLVIPHELLHGLAFKLTGAQTIRFGADWRLLVFHAAAPWHVMRSGTMAFVALLPFAIISGGLFALIMMSSEWWQWLGFGALLSHTQGCLGDFAMVNFFARQPRPRGWITYDEGQGDGFIFMYRA